MAAFALGIFVGDHSLAESAICRALTLNPNSVHAWMARGWNSGFLGRPERAIEALEHAMRLSPLDPLGYLFSGGLAFAYAVAGKFEKTLEWADRSLREQPRFIIPIRLKTAVLAHLGRVDEAREWLGRMLELQPALTIAEYKAYAEVWFQPSFLTWYLNGLRKAGLPEERSAKRVYPPRGNLSARISEGAVKAK